MYNFSMCLAVCFQVVGNFGLWLTTNITEIFFVIVSCVLSLDHEAQLHSLAFSFPLNQMCQ